MIFRYFLKINTVLSNESTSINEVTGFINDFFSKVKNEEIQTIGNIYFSGVFFNRAVPLKEARTFGEVDFRELPDFVDTSRIRTDIYKNVSFCENGCAFILDSSEGGSEPR